jgi:hypothetical protein
MFVVSQQASALSATWMGSTSSSAVRSRIAPQMAKSGGGQGWEPAEDRAQDVRVLHQAVVSPGRTTQEDCNEAVASSAVVVGVSDGGGSGL